MSKVSRKRRQFEIRKKRKRREKLKKLKEKFLSVKNQEEKDKILEKMKRTAPYLNVEEYIKEISSEK